MTSQQPSTANDLTLRESWASAFFDGEVSLPEHAGWDETIQEQLFYYSITRQVVRGQHLTHDRDVSFRAQRTTWAAFWAKVDAL